MNKSAGIYSKNEIETVRIMAPAETYVLRIEIVSCLHREAVLI